MNDLMLATEQRGQDFIHDDKLVIIDKSRHIRGILETSGKTLTEKLEKVKRIQDEQVLVEIMVTRLLHK